MSDEVNHCDRCGKMAQAAEDFRTIRLMELNIVKHIETAKHAALAMAARFDDLSSKVEEFLNALEEEKRARRMGSYRDEERP